ncbi:hypothetical protein CGSMWGv284V_06109 [Gardnerella vaginalis 284V]|nr:hypothetical protein CGSMWGv284V_06109 [Gardnerella vaginalis 284V]
MSLLPRRFKGEFNEKANYSTAGISWCTQSRIDFVGMW